MPKYLEMMDTSLRAVPAWVYIGVSLFVFVVAAIWLLLPFAVFGTKAILRKVLRKRIASRPTRHFVRAKKIA